MSTNSQLSDEKKNWLNSKLLESLRKPISEFTFLNDYVYYIVSQFNDINTEGPVYHWGSAGMGNIIVVKRDNKNSLINYQMFDTGYKPLDNNHEFIDGYNSVFEVIKQKKREIARNHNATVPYSMMSNEPVLTFGNP